ncbi:TetR/AcrR family transcriptional regulator [Marinobacterium sediminicola]|uniref:Transcriptional regulator, TetR family n=1 Tax=Marinobacterium sediminicola TaxID=518898 RepID=A0ABY1S2X1_9GAMM|nr:TetR/AcrR family transcriptional regulator [Marinobacterium sediminicola]ULG68845.1 TetR/AcrR family transcriptional regulator [Marinobacterium sediminicola]SMR77545.1 transcriptional regulator, TetR family [Marinobacterium sediminicola]
MSVREQKKQESRRKILDAAARRLREEGLDGAGIAAVMDDAGLTHGAFYSHFKNKDELARAAFVEALSGNREGWTRGPSSEPQTDRFERLAQRYLTREHRDRLDRSCALAALCSEAARGDDAFKQTYEAELYKSLSAIMQKEIADLDEQEFSDALAFMAMMLGSLALSRAVDSEQLSEAILEAGKRHAGRMTQ